MLPPTLLSTAPYNAMNFWNICHFDSIEETEQRTEMHKIIIDELAEYQKQIIHYRDSEKNTNHITITGY